MPVSKNWYCLSTVPKESPYRTRISLLPYIHHRPPILKGIQPHSQNHYPTHREAKWHPRAFQSKVLRLRSPVPIFTRKESPKETMFFAPRVYTRQPSPRPCITHLHQATFWQACPTAFGVRETLPTVLSTAPRVDFSVPGQHCHVVISTRDLLHSIGKKEIQLQGLKHFRAISLVNANASIIIGAKGIHLALI